MLLKMHARACRTHIIYYPESFSPGSGVLACGLLKIQLMKKRGPNILIYVFYKVQLHRIYNIIAGTLVPILKNQFVRICIRYIIE